MISTSKQDDHHDRLDSPDDWVERGAAWDHSGGQGRLGGVIVGTIYHDNGYSVGAIVTGYTGMM